MPTINIQADISVDVLISAAEQLTAPELRHFTSHVLALNAKRIAPSVTHEEAELLLRINARLSEDVQRRYAELIVKRDAEKLGGEEHAELLRLTKHVEAFEVARVEALSKLASRRGVTLAALMRHLDMASPGNA